MNQYEGMFLFDPTFGASLENCESEIRRLIERADAELLFCKKWDERRLAYRIKGRKRGVYVLTYFNASPNRIAPLERDIRISESILRALVLRADGVQSEMMEDAVRLKGDFADGSDGDSSGESDHRRDRSKAPAPRREGREAVAATAESTSKES